MPRVKLDYVVSFSSEDPDNPASTLLDAEISKRKWLGEKGEISNSVVIQLAKCTKIQSVTIGSYHSALVEVLVGRSERPADPFKVLVLNSIFMTPSESKRDEPVSKVRTFQYDQLSMKTRDQKWDRIRVVCRQPYNKHIKYGLSFIHIFEPENPSNDNVVTQKTSETVNNNLPKRFQIESNSSDEETSFRPGELFEKMKIAPKLSVDAQIRKASKPSSFQNSSEFPGNLSRITNKITSNKQNDNLKVPDERLNRDRDSILYDDDEENIHEKIDKLIEIDREEKRKREKSKKEKRKTENGQRTKEAKETDRRKDDKYAKDSRSKHTNPRESVSKNIDKDQAKKLDRESSTSDFVKKVSNKESSSSKHKRPHSEDRNNHRPSKKLKAGPRSSSPHRLMSDVIFAMSGYQNPERSSLRDKALAMGARYRQDWGPDCTHLICAFPNTPKLRQVRSSDDTAPIVTGEWITKCCEERRLLPWQWYATEPEYREKRGTEEEEVEVDVEEEMESDADTDDEIQKVLDMQKSPAKQNSSQHRASDSDTDEYTDEERTEDMTAEIDTKKSLPDFFEGFTFAVDAGMESSNLDINLLKRYIYAYSGEIVEHISDDSSVHYLITVDRGCEMRKKLKSAVLVRPEWIWKCHKYGKKLPSKDYAVK